MDESLPPPPAKSNNTGFIGAAVVMLLLMGGLIYWKVGGTKPTAEVEKPPPPVVSAAPPVLENTLPPPPPPEEDAGKPVEDPKTPTKKIGAGGGGGCAGECKGTPAGDFQSSLRSKAGQSRGCYDRALRTNSELQGKLTVAVRVGPQGQACSVNVSGSLGDASVISCVTSLFRSGTYPAPSGGCVEAAVPLNFVPASK